MLSSNCKYKPVRQRCANWHKLYLLISIDRTWCRSMVSTRTVAAASSNIRSWKVHSIRNASMNTTKITGTSWSRELETAARTGWSLFKDTATSTAITWSISSTKSTHSDVTGSRSRCLDDLLSTSLWKTTFEYRSIADVYFKTLLHISVFFLLRTWVRPGRL